MVESKLQTSFLVTVKVLVVGVGVGGVLFPKVPSVIGVDIAGCCC
jgi:hypothetical protein